MPGEDIQSWSVTAANNGNADTSINFAEGQARASVNNSARSMMAAHAKRRNLLAGSCVTSGTPNVQAFTSGVGYTSLPAGFVVRLTIGVGLTNTGPMTLNMDGIGDATVSQQGGVPMVAGIVQGNTYCEFLCNGSQWIVLDSTKVSKAGDTMTGDLHVQGLFCNGIANTGGTTLVGNATCGGTLGVGGTLNSTGIVNTGDLYVNSGTAIVAALTCTGASSFLSTLNSHGIINTGDLYNYGNAFKPGGGTWADSSDARIKTVLGDYSTGLAAIKQLSPVRYSFNGNDEDHDADGEEYIGLVAQDVEPIMPEMVTQTTGHIDGQRVTDLRMLDTTALIYALVNACQELSARLEALETG